MTESAMPLRLRRRRKRRLALIGAPQVAVLRRPPSVGVVRDVATSLVKSKGLWQHTGVISLADAAQQLGISPQRVQQMVAERQLPVRTFGNRIVLDTNLLAELGRRPAGRPLSANNAWALLAILSGDRPDFIDRTQLSKLRKLARDRDRTIRLLRFAQPRSTTHKLDFFPAQLPELASEVSLITGLFANVPELRLVKADETLDAYVSADALRKIKKRFKPVQSTSRPNALLRVPSHPWVLQHGVTPIIVAADLLNDSNPRVARAAESLF